jgi:peroxiredoxin
MKIFALVFLIALPIISIAQSQFNIKVTGNAFKNGDKVYLVYKTQDAVIADSMLVTTNSFEFKGKIKYPAKGTLYKNVNPMYADIIYDNFDFYIEPGNIMIHTDDSLRNAAISGTQNNLDMVTINAKLKRLVDARNKINIAYEALSPVQQKDINKLANFREQINNINKAMEPIRFAFVKSHPGSYISLITLTDLYHNIDLAPQINDAYYTLAVSVRSTPLGISFISKINASIKSMPGLYATDFVQPDTRNSPVRLSDYKGKYILVDFWASWCAPCRAENPDLVSTYQKYKAKGFTILGVSLDDKSTKKAWLDAIKSDGLQWTQVSDLKGWGNDVARLYGIKTIPSNILIDPSGKIIARNITDRVLDAKLKELLND